MWVLCTCVQIQSCTQRIYLLSHILLFLAVELKDIRVFLKHRVMKYITVSVGKIFACRPRTCQWLKSIDRGTVHVPPDIVALKLVSTAIDSV